MALENKAQKLKRESLEGLPAIVAATQSEIGYMFAPLENAEWLNKNGLVEFDVSITNEAGFIATRATTKGIEKVMSENVQVEAYGSIQPLKAVASISVADTRTIKMEVWDMSVIKAVEKALMNADLGMMPTVDGKSLRLNLPMMTDEQRQKMVKIVKEKLEETRISIRQIREEAKKEINRQESVGEDEKHRHLEALDKLVKDKNETVEAIGKKKEIEITTI